MGAYARGSNPEIDLAIQMNGKLNSYLRQPVEERATFEESVEQLQGLLSAPAVMNP
ncbi:MAG: hypothetical protein NTW86_29490 [Candidatus Sumerlaeota bacterium]|nr:hypothetical protein [Candidatus Sumerlaeota bacterium]